MDEYRPALASYLDEEGRLKQLPGKRQKPKLDLMIAYLASFFEPGIKYSEREVNDILNDLHSFQDPATLRRLLFGTGRLDRTVDGRGVLEGGGMRATSKPLCFTKNPIRKTEACLF